MPKVVFNVAFTSKYPPRNLKPAQKAEYLARRSFYNMTADYNYFTYTLNGEKVVKNKDIFDYMLNPEKHKDEISDENTGAFNLKGRINRERLEKIKEKLKTTDSHIWHGVISFDAETSKGFITQEKAIKFLNQSFNAFLERTQLNKNNIELIASLHEDTDNMHIHFSFFEKEPMRRNCRGELGYTAKGTFNNAALENYLVSANMHMSDNSYDYYTARERAMDRLKALRADAAENKFNNRDIRTTLLELADKLPKTGRLQYNSDNINHLRKDIDSIAELIIKSDPEAAAADRAFRAALAAKEQEAYDVCHDPVNKQLQYVNNRELRGKEVQQLLREGKTEYIRANNINWENIDYFERLRQDYKARIGNQVLGLVKDMRRDFKAKNRAVFNDHQKKRKCRSNRRAGREIIYNFMTALGGYQKGIQADFTKRLDEIEYEIQRQQYSENA